MDQDKMLIAYSRSWMLIYPKNRMLIYPKNRMLYTRNSLLGYERMNMRLLRCESTDLVEHLILLEEDGLECLLYHPGYPTPLLYR